MLENMKEIKSIMKSLDERFNRLEEASAACRSFSGNILDRLTLIDDLRDEISLAHRKISFLEGKVDEMYCCHTCWDAKIEGRPTPEKVYFGKKMWRDKVNLLKVTQRDDGSYWSTHKTVDADGYTCYINPCEDSFMDSELGRIIKAFFNKKTG